MIYVDTLASIMALIFSCSTETLGEDQFKVGQVMAGSA